MNKEKECPGAKDSNSRTTSGGTESAGLDLTAVMRRMYSDIKCPLIRIGMDNNERRDFINRLHNDSRGVSGWVRDILEGCECTIEMWEDKYPEDVRQELAYELRTRMANLISFLVEILSRREMMRLWLKEMSVLSDVLDEQINKYEREIQKD
jgi:hypothetical protein